MTRLEEIEEEMTAIASTMTPFTELHAWNAEHRPRLQALRAEHKALSRAAVAAARKAGELPGAIAAEVPD